MLPKSNNLALGEQSCKITLFNTVLASAHMSTVATFRSSPNPEARPLRAVIHVARVLGQLVHDVGRAQPLQAPRARARAGRARRAGGARARERALRPARARARPRLRPRPQRVRRHAAAARGRGRAPRASLYTDEARRQGAAAALRAQEVCQPGPLLRVLSTGSITSSDVSVNASKHGVCHTRWLADTGALSP